MKKAIYVITGVMASGKSTVAELLSHSLEGACIFGAMCFGR